MTEEQPYRWTKKESLKVMSDYWAWLIRHPGKDMLDWPGWKENGGTYPASACPLSLYYGDRDKDCLEECPLNPLWKGKGCIDESNPNNPYTAWIKWKSRSGSARAIAAEARYRLKKEINKKGKGR